MKQRYYTISLSLLTALFLFAAEPLSARSNPLESASQQAPQRVHQILARVASGFKSMGPYTVGFEIEADQNTSRGQYSVAKESYYLTLGDAEIFGDGKATYEVDNRRREVTIDVVDQKSGNILNNPVRAFDFLDDEFTATLLDESDGVATIKLVPTKNSEVSTDNIILKVNTATMRPESLSYNYDGESIRITVVVIERLKEALKTFSKSNYADYEMIDFR